MGKESHGLPIPVLYGSKCVLYARFKHRGTKMIKCLETGRREITLFNLAHALGYLCG